MVMTKVKSGNYAENEKRGSLKA